MGRGAGDRAGVVVLDSQHAGVAGQQRGQFVRPRPIPGRAGRSLGARGEQHGLAARAERVAQRVRRDPVVVDRHRHGGQVRRGQQIERGRVAGILHSDPVTRPQPRLKYPLDPVERAADHGQVLRVDAVRP